MLDIYTLGDEVLREKCEKVTTFDNALSILVDAMFDTMEEADGI
jgi:peptide deformylase